ncbi:MAG TPA: NlpC/P60 family protein [Thermomicrobiales bacterium]|nr:NlpC/P60 family protein [Thermomicrobiales bacterium]
MTTTALQHLGTPYVWGGTSPAGWDCSGFVQWVFHTAAGVDLPRTAGEQASVGVLVPANAIQPGDLVFFVNTYAPGISHVGISLGGDRFIEAAAEGVGTIVASLSDPYYQAHFIGARRPLAEDGAAGAALAPGVPMPLDAGPPLAPEQLLPTFTAAAQLTGVPVNVLLGIARVESGFDPHAVGPYLPQFAGTEDQFALGLMQFLPSTYRPYAGAVDQITGKNLGLNGIWDAESAIYAAAFYLKDNGAPGDLHRAIFAYNHADWYVGLVLAWANYYAGGVIPDPNMFVYDGQGRPIAAPENPLLPVQTGQHVDSQSAIPLYAPFPAGQTWHAGQGGGKGGFYGQGLHTDATGAYYAVDFAKGTVEHPEDGAGQPVLAAADGIVNNVYATVGGGWTVEIYSRTPEGTLIRQVYANLRDDPRQSAKLKVNQPVVHGTTIGFVGGTPANGAHTDGQAATLSFALYILKDGKWVSLRPEPMEGHALTDGGAVLSHNNPAGLQAFAQVWVSSDQAIADGQQQHTWVWGPAPFASSTAETDLSGKDGMRVVQYYDKGRMEAISDGKGGYTVVTGNLGTEMLTGKVDLGNGKTLDLGPAQIPLAGNMQDPTAPTYADVAVLATHPTFDYHGQPVTWRLTRGGQLVPFTPPTAVYLTNYDPVTQHNLADVFARWLLARGLSADNGNLSAASAAFLDPGHPLSDPFWITVNIDGTPRTVLVQVFERWVLTYTPDNPPGWQIELGNIGLHYYAWRYELPLQTAALNSPNAAAPSRRRYIKRKPRTRPVA